MVGPPPGSSRPSECDCFHSPSSLSFSYCQFSAVAPQFAVLASVSSTSFTAQLSSYSFYFVFTVFGVNKNPFRNVKAVFLRLPAQSPQCDWAEVFSDFFSPFLSDAFWTASLHRNTIYVMFYVIVIKLYILNYIWANVRRKRLSEGRDDGLNKKDETETDGEQDKDTWPMVRYVCSLH